MVFNAQMKHRYVEQILDQADDLYADAAVSGESISRSNALVAATSPSDNTKHGTRDATDTTASMPSAACASGLSVSA